MIKHELVFV